jgi:hypothetical protein
MTEVKKIETWAGCGCSGGVVVKNDHHREELEAGRCPACIARAKVYKCLEDIEWKLHAAAKAEDRAEFERLKKVYRETLEQIDP